MTIGGNMFKVGDKVRILGKSVGQSLQSTRFKVGDITTIFQINDTVIWIRHYKTGKKHFFFKDDLELVDKSYKQLKLFY